MKRVAIYVRVSTEKQAVEMQLTQLTDYVARCGWNIVKQYQDVAWSGKNTQRPAYREMMAAAHRREFDVLLVWKLDRLGRSLKDLVNTLAELSALGIDFVSYENQLNTSTPTGKLLFQIMGCFAEFERDICSERVRAGIANARTKGRHPGRPRVDASLLSKAKKLRDEGKSFRAIARDLGIDEKTLRNYKN